MLTSRQKDYINNLPKEIAEKPVEIFPWENRGLDIAKSVIDSIKSSDSKLKVFLRGSVPLKIAGQRDIDLTCNDLASTFENHIEKLKKVLGVPSKQNDSSIVWHFFKDGYEISFYVVDPTKSDQLDRQTKMYSLFKNNHVLLSEYEKLKLSLNGVSYKTYTEEKYIFFNQILEVKAE